MRTLLLFILIATCARCDDKAETLNTTIFERVEVTDYDGDLPQGGIKVTVKMPRPQSECAADDYEEAAMILLQQAMNARKRGHKQE